MQPDIPASARLQVRLFGPLEIWERRSDLLWECIPRERWNRRQDVRSLLKRLLAAPGRRLECLQIIDDLWSGKDDEQADHLLRDCVSVLRKVIGRDFVTTLNGGYGLADQSVIWVDADACRELVKEAERVGDRVQALPLLEAASALLEQGAYLEGEGGEWCHGLRTWYEKRLKLCRLWLTEAYEQAGRFVAASEQYERLLQEPLLDEETRRSYRKRQNLVEMRARSPSLPVVTVSNLETVHIGLETTDILALAWRWKPSFGSIAMLQQLFGERMHDMTHDSISRRQALEAIIKFPLQVQGITLLSSKVVLFPSDDVLPLCAAGISACWELRQYEAEGMRAIQDTLAAYLPALEKLARQSGPSQQNAAYLAAQGYLLATLLANRNGKPEQMGIVGQKARFYAQVAQSVDMEAATLIQLGEKYGNENHQVKALEIFQEAAALPEFFSVSPLIRANVYAGLAGKLSYCQQPSGALSFLRQAKEIYPTEPESDPSFTFANFNKTILTVWEGVTLERVGHYTEAANTFSQFGSLTPLPGLRESHRAEHLNGVASVAIKQQDLDAAFVYLDTAFDVAQSIQHKQRQTETRETLRDMQRQWPNEPKVKQLQEKIYAR